MGASVLISPSPTPSVSQERIKRKWGDWRSRDFEGNKPQGYHLLLVGKKFTAPGSRDVPVGVGEQSFKRRLS